MVMLGANDSYPDKYEFKEKRIPIPKGWGVWFSERDGNDVRIMYYRPKQKKFKATWSKKVYGNTKPKVVGIDFMVEANGFSKDDIEKILHLKVGQKYREHTPMGIGLTLERIK